jgi:hypothetical protein
MFWKFFSISKILDALFDDGWCDLGLPEADDGLDATLATLG